MKVSFNKDIKVAGIGLVPWTRLGPETWLDNYKIASLYGLDINHLESAPEVLALSDGKYPIPSLKRQNSQSMLDSTQFQELLTDNFLGYSMMTYKPVKPPQILLDAGIKFLHTNQQLAKSLENKAEFRKLFGPLGVPFPSYEILDINDISNDGSDFEGIAKGRNRFILQEDKLSGGKGTKVVSTDKELAAALEDIQSIGTGDKLVISDFIEGAHERTVQCCVTKYGIFVGPLQKQIVANPLLSNLEVAEGDRFCGAEISNTDALIGVYSQIKEQALKIGEKIQEMGYKGIFGLDCLVTDAGELYVLEINPRITGVTPLLTMLYRQDQDIPFYLLHILELGNFDYTIEDYDINPQAPEGSLMIIHSKSNEAVVINDLPKSGLYKMPQVELVKDAIRFDIDDTQDWIIQQYTPPGFKIKPGGRLMSAYARTPILDSSDRLLPSVQESIKGLLNRTSTSSIKSGDPNIV